MATYSSGGYTFTTTSSGRVTVTGPGIPSYGIDLGYAGDLSAGNFAAAASSPNITPEAAAALESLGGSAGSIKTSLTQGETPAAVESTGQTTTEAQQANAEGADPQTPNIGPQTASPDGTVSSASNTVVSTAEPSNAGELTTGTDGRVRSAEDVQSSASSTPNATSADDAANGGTATGVSTPTSSGAAAQGDDGAGLNAVSSYIARNYASALNVTPRDNPLDKFPSYTYNLSVYLMTPEQYSAMLSAQKPSVAGLLLLMSSGGAPTAERNQYFPLDYYMDTLQIKTYVSGKGTMGAHTATELHFRVTEPNGLTFIHNLARATRATVGITNSETAFHNQHYLMTIRFQAMDVNGALINAPSVGGTSSDATIIEKFIPFRITGIRTKVANKLAEYDVSAVCPQNNVATAQRRGVIPYNIQLQASTLQDLLSVQFCNALNKFQVDLTKPDPKQNRAEGVFEYPDVYKIKLLEPLNDPSVTTMPPGELNRVATAMGPDPATAPPNQTMNPATQATKTTVKPMNASAGMSIVQFIDQTVRTSGYIYQQQKKYYDAKTKDLVTQSGVGKYLAWYRISTQAKPLKWDRKRNDYAYEITYQVAPYLVTDSLSEFFPVSPRWPAPKVYYHWFTGQNTQILDYQQDFNYLYYLVVNSPQPVKSASPLKNETDKGYQPNSGQTAQGIAGQVNEPGANAADRFYNVGDLLKINMTIVGDPDWIAQGDAWSGIKPLDPSATLSDGTINFASREPLFDVIFNTPADYDMNQGIVPSPSIPSAVVTSSSLPSRDIVNTRYLATWVVNHFDKGKFTQELYGAIVQLDQTPKTQASEAAVATTGGGTPMSSTPMNQRTLEAQSAAGYGERAPINGEYGYPNIVTEPPGTPQNQRTLEAQSAAGYGPSAYNNEIGYPNDTGSTTSAEPTPSIGPQAPPEPPTSNGQDVGIVDSSDQELTLVSTRRADRLAQEQATATTEPPQNMAQEY